MKNIFLLLLNFLFVLSACRKEVDGHIIIIEEELPIVLVESSLRGKVLNEAGIPMANALVKVGNNLLYSDINGSFHFKKISVKKEGTIIKAKMSGYFEGITYSNFTAEGGAFVEIKMMEKGAYNTIQSNTGGHFITDDGMEITIPQDVIGYANGSSYNGEVAVYARWLDTSDGNVAGVMPGNLTATAEDGSPLALASYGMVVVKLETLMGDELEVVNEAKIEVKIPIPNDLLVSAPPNIPLWYFDLAAEEWLLSGLCAKEGSSYVCSIPSTGYWNCDVALPAICLSGQVFNSDSIFSAYLKVIVEDLTDNFIYWGYTDSTGYFYGSVPQAALLRLTIKDLCDNVVYTTEIGPYADDFQLSDIYLDVVVEEFLINIKGTVLHCITTDIPDGHLAVTYPGKLRIYPFESGGFDVDLALKCVEFPNLSISVYSSSQRAVTSVVNYSDFAAINLGEQLTCEELPDYFDMNIDGVGYWASPTQFYIKNNTTTDWLVLEGWSGAGKFVLDIRNYQGLGTYNENVFLQIENNVPLPEYPVFMTSSPDITLIISLDDGAFIEGNITGVAVDNMGEEIILSGNFKIKKAI